MSCYSISVPIPIDSSLSVIVTQLQIQKALFKPLNNHLGRDRGRPLSYRLNYCASITPLRCSAGGGGGGGGAVGEDDDDAIVLNVGGMMCEGCASSVKKILESRPQVSSASVNLTSEIAIVSTVPEEKTAPNWQKQLGEALAQHLTSCGFSSTLRGQEVSD